MPVKNVIIEYVTNQFPFPKGEELVVIYNDSSKKYSCNGWQLIYFDLTSNKELFRYAFKELDGTFDPRERICINSGRGTDEFVKSREEPSFPGAHWDLFTHKPDRVMNVPRIHLTLLDEDNNLIDSMIVERIHPEHDVNAINNQHLKCFLSYRFSSENKFKLRIKTIIPMFASAFFWAIEAVIFKMVALEENIIRSLFWEHIALVLVGVIIFIFIRPYRDNFLLAIKNNSKNILALNVLNESMYILGNISVGFAYLLAPIGLVLLGESFQPIFVFAIGIFFTIFFPRITVEKIHARHIWQKIIAIFITGIGTYLLLIS